MSEQTQIQKPAPQERTTETAHAPQPTARDAEVTDLLDETEDLLADIDAALDDVLDAIDEALDAALGETSAQDFVAGYVQKGGQ